MNKVTSKDIVISFLFIVTGVVFLIASLNFQFGHLEKVGPAFFPFLFSSLLTMIGLIKLGQVLLSYKNELYSFESLKFNWKVIFYVTASVFSFGIWVDGVSFLNIPSLGLFAGILSMTFLASRATEGFKAISAIKLSILLSILTYIIFIKILKMQIPIFPAFFKI